jgi:hypothetical protein
MEAHPLGREAQVRRLHGYPQGKRADIQVDLGPPGQDPPSAGPWVVAEVEGPWHRYVASTLGDSLVGRFLAGQSGAVGPVRILDRRPRSRRLLPETPVPGSTREEHPCRFVPS